MRQCRVKFHRSYFGRVCPGLAAVLVLSIVHAPAVSADDAPVQTFSFGGFGTVGAVRSSQTQADYTTAYYQPNGAGYTRQWSADLDTTLGLQALLNASSQLSAIVQVVTTRQWDNAYRPRVEWANVKYAFTPDFNVRVGRIVLPTFLASDSRKMGYTTAWVRPPLETYSLYEFTSNDGVDASYRFRLGEASNTVTAVYGQTKVTSPDGTPEGFPTEVKDSLSLVNRFELGPATLHLAYERAKIHQPTLAQDPLLAPYASFSIRVVSLGAIYDPGAWFVTGEWIRLTAKDLSRAAGWYVGGGYRLGNWTPYAMLSRRGKIRTLDGSGEEAEPVAQRTKTVGVRWDAAKNLALKLQYERIKPDENSAGLLYAQPGFKPGSGAHVVSIVADFVF